MREEGTHLEEGPSELGFVVDESDLLGGSSLGSWSSRNVSIRPMSTVRENGERTGFRGKLSLELLVRSGEFGKQSRSNSQEVTTSERGNLSSLSHSASV